MRLAVKRLEGIGWLALVFLVAILLYPLSLSVATLRSDLKQTDDQIVAVTKEIRYLQTEFGARANLRQLEHWNKMEFGYVAPRAAQYLDGERALANLGGKDLRKPVEVALISSMDKVKPAGIIGSVFASADAKTRRPDGSASPVDADNGLLVTGNEKPSGQMLRETRTERVADMEDKLLDDGLVKQLAAKASQEEAGSSAQ